MHHEHECYIKFKREVVEYSMFALIFDNRFSCHRISIIASNIEKQSKVLRSWLFHCLRAFFLTLESQILNDNILALLLL